MDVQRNPKSYIVADMNYKFTKFTFIYFILLIANFQALACWLREVYEFDVYVVNDLPNGSILRVHCASGDDELGYHNLAVHQNLNFTFCMIPWTTLFFCHLWWGNKNKAFEVFNAKWVPKIWCTHHECYWVAKEDGIYFSGSYQGELKKKYDWEMNKLN